MGDNDWQLRSVQINEVILLLPGENLMILSNRYCRQENNQI
jgi:hypothetical protein